MGFPLRTNIFASDSEAQREFARFPIQVMVLFSPEDIRFVDAFRQLFLELDRLTGSQVAFFAVLDPPSDWVEAAAHRPWWRDYQRQFGTLGFTYDDTTLVREIARLFGVAWHQLPVLAASTDLWTTECVITPTSPWHIERQLRSLTELAREWGRPTIGHILETLRNDFGEQVRYHPAAFDVRDRMDRVYQVLNTYEPERPRANARFWRLATREARAANRLTGNPLDRRTRENRNRPDARFADNFPALDSDQHDVVLTDAVGYLVAPAAVAAKLRPRDAPMQLQFIDRFDMNGLEGDSRAMVNSSLQAHNLLDILVAKGEFGEQDLDFATGVQGMWKAFELEINYSLIQAARLARTVAMPDYFTLRHPSLPKDKAKVQTRNKTCDINGLDPKEPAGGHHRFLTLGDAWHVTAKLASDPNELFATVIQQFLHGQLDPGLMDRWHRVNAIRNDGSHSGDHPKTGAK